MVLIVSHAGPQPRSGPFLASRSNVNDWAGSPVEPYLDADPRRHLAQGSAWVATTAATAQ